MSPPTELVLAGNATLHASQPLRLQGIVDWSYTPGDQPRWAGQVQADGDLNRLTAKGSLAEPLSATFDGRLLDLTHDWHWEATVEARDFTLKPWSPNSPVNIPSASLAGQGAGERLQLSANALAQVSGNGPARYQGRRDVRRSGLCMRAICRLLMQVERHHSLGIRRCRFSGRLAATASHRNLDRTPLSVPRQDAHSEQARPIHASTARYRTNTPSAQMPPPGRTRRPSRVAGSSIATPSPGRTCARSCWAGRSSRTVRSDSAARRLGK